MSKSYGGQLKVTEPVPEIRSDVNPPVHKMTDPSSHTHSHTSCFCVCSTGFLFTWGWTNSPKWEQLGATEESFDCNRGKHPLSASVLGPSIPEGGGSKLPDAVSLSSSSLWHDKILGLPECTVCGVLTSMQIESLQKSTTAAWQLFDEVSLHSRFAHERLCVKQQFHWHVPHYTVWE